MKTETQQQSNLWDLLKPWLLAARPKTLFAALSPVIVGLAFSAGTSNSFHPLMAIATLLCALLMQVGTNYVNDYFDARSGVDDHQRLGPLRAIHLNLITADQLQKGYRLVFLLAFFIGLALINRGGTPIAIIGISSILLAYMYTAGPFPLSHYALGEVTAFIYFGPIAVWGTIYLQNPSTDILTSPLAWSLGLGQGFISATIMAINNLRDRENDRKKNKWTLAVLLGEKGARILTLTFVFLSALWPAVLAFLTKSFWPLLATLITVLFMSSWKQIWSSPIDQRLNQNLAQTGKYLLIYSLALSLSFFLVKY